MSPVVHILLNRWSSLCSIHRELNEIIQFEGLQPNLAEKNSLLPAVTIPGEVYENDNSAEASQKNRKTEQRAIISRRISGRKRPVGRESNKRKDADLARE